MGYPTSVMVFTENLNLGATVYGYYFSDAYNEIVAIEQGLLNGFAHHLKFATDNTYDIGTSTGSRPRNLYLAGNATIGGSLSASSVSISGSFSAGSLSTSGTLSAGATTLSGALSFSADNTYDIGTSTGSRPRNLYLASNATIGGSLSAGSGSISGALGVSGLLTASGNIVTNSLTALQNPGSITFTVNSASVNQPQYVAIQDSLANTPGIRLYAAYGGNPHIQTTGGSFSSPIVFDVCRDDYVSILRVLRGSMGQTSGSVYRALQIDADINSVTHSRGLEFWSNTGGATPVLQHWVLIADGSSRQLQLQDATNNLRVFTVDPVAKMLLGSPSYSGLGVPTVTILTSGSGTYTPPSGARALKVLLVGGGGGGAGGAAPSGYSAGGGGGAGAALLAWIPPSAFVSGYSYAVGAGGAGGAAGGNGSAGGNTTLSWTVGSTTYTLTAGGGGGGTAKSGSTNAIGGSGGIASATIPSTVKAQGFPGAPGTVKMDLSVSVGGIIPGGDGGNSIFGGGGLGNIAANGNPAQGPGSGGAGGSSTSNGTTATNYAGAAGAAGIIIIEEYY